MDAKAFIELFRETFEEWSEDKAPRLAAALSYYTVFSLAPLLIIAIAVAGFFLGRGDVQQQILSEVETMLGPEGRDLVQGLIQDSSRPGANLLAMVVGIVTLVFGASGVYGQLQEALNTIWEVESAPDAGIWDTIRKRFLSFTMVLGSGFLLLVSLLLSAALSAASEYFSNLLPGTDSLWQILNVVASYAVITLLFALVFKVLPDVEIEWGDVWIGAAVTALLFTIGKFLIGWYLGTSAPGSTYGGAGSLVVILLWVYYSAQILFFGAEFTQVYARHYGSRIVPSEGAISLEMEPRLQERVSTEVAVRMRRRAPLEEPAQQSSPAREMPPVETTTGEVRSQEAYAPRKRPASLGYVLGFGAFVAVIGFIWDRLRGG
ncbi:MAG TPA: YihY/virulence factor BrkB family protein [Anaerolineales bacterium]